MTFVFDLEHDHDLPSTERRLLIGAKAANLAVMRSNLRLPVPPGFVVSTAACNAYLTDGWPAALDLELRAHMRHLEEQTAHQFGGAADPLLVSVRSGAPESMPGMMDTILNLGLNEETSAGLALATGNPAFARDCQDRFGVVFEALIGRRPPHDVWDQLRAAIEAVFRSWNSERARAYRQIESISDELGSAVTIQAMVFGNIDTDSATGVLFTRNPATGERAPFGDVLFEAQGEDVVSGTRTTFPVAVLDERMPAVATSLWQYGDLLERHFVDMCDIEFTIEQGQLWLLQARVGKRGPQAALRMAIEMAEDPAFPLSREQAVRRVASLLASPPRLTAGHPDDVEPVTCGLPASPGLAAGEIVTSAAAAGAASDAGRPFILVRRETSPDDVPVMAQAAGVLTALGGIASHAAVVARGWGVPAVVSAADLEVTDDGVIIGGRPYPAGTILSIDGSTGQVYAGAVAGEPVPVPEAATLSAWAREAGIELPALADNGSSTSARTHPGRPATVSREDIIDCLSIKGLASIETLAEALLTTAAAVQPVLAELVETGAVLVTAGSARLTDAGAARAAALTQARGQRWGAGRALDELDAFLPLDKRIKTAVTAWQLRDIGGQQTLNDHADPEYDGAVLLELQAIHAEVSAWLYSVTDAPGPVSRYAARLDRAALAVAAGDHRFISSPRVDSYHSVWFELHEELIRLAGRTRADEAASGRA
jgi:pyruvate,orthophosphate dikinase